MLKRLASLTLATSLALLGSSPAAAAETTDPADAAAGWLAGRLVDGDHFVSPFGNAWAYGLTLDSTLSFAAAGVGKTSAGKALTWLSQKDRLEDYAGNGTDRSIAGRYAKLVLAADVNGADPADFNNIDLVARLTARENADGRFVDITAGTDSSSPFNQSLVIIALERLPAGASDKAIGYLVGAQCPDGSFPFAFGSGGTCAGDSDSTTIAMQALAIAGEDDAVAKATTWLLAKQKANGAFADDWAGEDNANNTAMAVLALKAAGKNTEAGKAAAFLKTLQMGCDKPATQRGAIAYNAGGYDESTVDYATIQAIWGLAGTSLADLDSANSVADAPTLKCETGGTGGGELPVTGVQIWTIVAVGGGLLLIGALIVVFGRRRA